MSRRSRGAVGSREGRTARANRRRARTIARRRWSGGRRGDDNARVPLKPEPAILDVQAGLGDVKSALAALGATAPEQRSVAFVIGEHLLLLAYDEIDKFTTIAVGGPEAVRTAHELAGHLGEQGLPVTGVLPRLDGLQPG